MLKIEATQPTYSFILLPSPYLANTETLALQVARYVASSGKVYSYVRAELPYTHYLNYTISLRRLLLREVQSFFLTYSATELRLTEMWRPEPYVVWHGKLKTGIPESAVTGNAGPCDEESEINLEFFGYK